MSNGAVDQHRLTVPVLLDGWQIECCGTPPAVGDEVSWRLCWGPGLTSLVPSDMELHASLEELPAPDRDTARRAALPALRMTEETVPAVAKVGGLKAFVVAPVPLSADITLTGVLHEDHHTDQLPEGMSTTGRITGVWLVSWDLRLRDRSWRRVDGSAELTSVPRAPKHLRNEPPPEDGGLWRNTSAVLADLEVTPD
jgi:hypothetical protein